MRLTRLVREGSRLGRAPRGRSGGRCPGRRRRGSPPAGRGDPLSVRDRYILLYVPSRDRRRTGAGAQRLFQTARIWPLTPTVQIWFNRPHQKGSDRPRRRSLGFTGWWFQDRSMTFASGVGDRPRQGGATEAGIRRRSARDGADPAPERSRTHASPGAPAGRASGCPDLSGRACELACCSSRRGWSGSSSSPSTRHWRPCITASRTSRSCSPRDGSGSTTTPRCSGTPLFWKSIGNTLYLTLVGVPLAVGVALGIALLLNNRAVRGLGVFRTIFYLPVVIPASPRRSCSSSCSTRRTASSTRPSGTSASTDQAGSLIPDGRRTG